jgi:hypothetical protein
MEATPTSDNEAVLVLSFFSNAFFDDSVGSFVSADVGFVSSTDLLSVIFYPPIKRKIRDKEDLLENTSGDRKKGRKRLFCWWRFSFQDYSAIELELGSS